MFKNSVEEWLKLKLMLEEKKKKKPCSILAVIRYHLYSGSFCRQAGETWRGHRLQHPTCSNACQGAGQAGAAEVLKVKLAGGSAEWGISGLVIFMPQLRTQSCTARMWLLFCLSLLPSLRGGTTTCLSPWEHTFAGGEQPLSTWNFLLFSWKSFSFVFKKRSLIIVKYSGDYSACCSDQSLSMSKSIRKIS